MRRSIGVLRELVEEVLFDDMSIRKIDDNIVWNLLDTGIHKW